MVPWMPFSCPHQAPVSGPQASWSWSPSKRACSRWNPHPQRDVFRACWHGWHAAQWWYMCLHVNLHVNTSVCTCVSKMFFSPVQYWDLSKETGNSFAQKWQRLRKSCFCLQCRKWWWSMLGYPTNPKKIGVAGVWQCKNRCISPPFSHHLQNPRVQGKEPVDRRPVQMTNEIKKENVGDDVLSWRNSQA